MRHIWETLLDWQVWLHILVYMSIIAPCKFTSNALAHSLACSLMLTGPYVSVRYLVVPAVSASVIRHAAPSGLTHGTARHDLVQSSMGTSTVRTREE